MRKVALQDGNTQNTEDRQQQRSDLRNWWTSCMRLRRSSYMLVHIAVSKNSYLTQYVFLQVLNDIIALLYISS